MIRIVKSEGDQVVLNKEALAEITHDMSEFFQDLFQTRAAQTSVESTPTLTREEVLEAQLSVDSKK